MSEIIIRTFERQDQQEVAQMYRAGMNAYSEVPILKECTKWFVDDKLKMGGDMSNVQMHFMDNKKDGKRRCFWVAVQDGNIVGVVGAMPSVKYENYVELVRMSVSANCRKMGVGSRLIKTLEDWAREQGYSHVYLTTLEKMNLAVDLYSKNGFELVELEPADFSGHFNVTEQDAVVNVCHFIKPL